jgi:acetolactate synthase I/II/III large subunit
MKLSDYVAQVIKKLDINCVFGLQGGAVVHIFDSIERNGTEVLYTHHEQAASLAAGAYAKINNTMGCAVVTSGPGATNAITGLLAAWQDSIPCLFISGQVRSDQLSYGKKIRQVGTQEVNIIDIVRPITKYSKCIFTPDEVENTFKNAIFHANNERPGPVWIDIPVDLQWQNITFDPNKIFNAINDEKKMSSKLLFKKSVNLINASKKPLFILGYGLRLADKQKNIIKFLEKHLLPFVTTWTAADFTNTDNPLNMGIIGMSGQRGANKAIFEADLLICLGTHLCAPQTTTLFKSYAPNAKKIIVNIDKEQLKNLNISFDLKINADLKEYINYLDISEVNVKSLWSNISKFKNDNWYKLKKTKFVNSYDFIRKFSLNNIKDCCYIVDGGGTALYAGFQSTLLKKNDRILCSSAISAMGTGLAESIGAFKTKKYKDHICIIGDGSFIMNIQDLQTIYQESINIKILVINNNGYQAIRNTQNEFLEGRLFGTHPDWNLKMPSIEKITKGFQINYMKVDRPEVVDDAIKEINDINGPLVVEIIIDENQKPLFKQKFTKNIDGTFTPHDLSEMICDD